MNDQHVQGILSRVGAIITDSHIVYTSGKHGSAYVNKDALYPHTRETSELCLLIAERFADDKIDVVIAPAVGGIIMSQWIAFHLTKITGRDVLGVYAEKEVGSFRHPDSIGKLDVPIKMAYEETGRFVIKRGYDKLVKGTNVLVVEDVLTTGESARKVVVAVRAIGGNVIGVGALCNRGNVTSANLSVPKFFALIDVDMGAWAEEFCPFCKRGDRINTDVGKGRDYLARKEVAKNL